MGESFLIVAKFTNGANPLACMCEPDIVQNHPREPGEMVVVGTVTLPLRQEWDKVRRASATTGSRGGTSEVEWIGTKLVDTAEAETASRYSLSEGWKERRQLLDWMAVPGMATYVNGMVSGLPMSNGGHWAQYAARRFIVPLAEQLGRPLNVVSLGCGGGRIENSLFAHHGWPIGRMVGLEYDAALRAAAEELWSKHAAVQSSFEFLDFNAPAAEIDFPIDVIFTCHAIHHATDLEKFLPFIDSLFSDHTIFVGIDYFGPTRFMVEHDVRAIIDRLNDQLPLELRRDLRTGEIVPHVQYSTLESIMQVDPSEAARSSDLRTMLFNRLPIEEIKPMGGTLLRWLFQYRAGNFDRENPEHRAIAAYLIEIERTLIEAKTIISDDLFFVLRSPNSVPAAAS